MDINRDKLRKDITDAASDAIARLLDEVTEEVAYVEENRAVTEADRAVLSGTRTDVQVFCDALRKYVSAWRWPSGRAER